jgi:hypothetical protein
MSKSLIPNERIVSKIIAIRDEKVMLDVHIAELYGIETRALKQAVEINIAIIRAFVMLRKMLYNYKELLEKQEILS